MLYGKYWRFFSYLGWGSIIIYYYKIISMFLSAVESRENYRIDFIEMLRKFG